MKLWFADIATVVGFYAVSLPFFEENHPLLTGSKAGDRLSVSTRVTLLKLGFF